MRTDLPASPAASSPRLPAACRGLLLALAVCLAVAAGAPRLPAATLLKTNFEGSNPWTGMAGYFSTAGGTVTATPTYHASAGTIDAYGSSASSAGLLLTINSSAATGAWKAGLDSGVLAQLTSDNAHGAGFRTLSFSLSASSANPVRVRIESYNSSNVRTGGLSTLIFPAAPDFYQRYAMDVDPAKMTVDGTGTFSFTDPKVRIYFELDSTANGTGWPNAAAHALKVDNVNYSTPKYYVKPGGAGTQDGLTEANALATVQAAVNKTFSGDNIIAIMDDGVAGGVDYDSSNVNGDLATVSKAGTPDAWIVFKNYPGHAPVLRTNGWNVFRICNTSGGASAAYVEVRGLTVRGNSFVDANGDRQILAAYQPYVGLVDSRSNGNGISVDGRSNSTNKPHHVRVADNVIEYCAGGNGGGNGDRFTFENNVVRYNCWWMIYAGSGISFGFAENTEAGDNYRMLIRDNVVYGNETMVPWKIASNPYSDGNGIIIDSYSADYSGKTLVQSNLVYNNGGSGIHVLKSSKVDIIHNTAYYNSASSSEAYGEIFTQSFDSVAGKWVKDVRVTNNVMVARRNPTGVNSYLYNESATSVASFDPSTIRHTRNVYAGGDNSPLLSGANFSDNTDLGRAYDPASLFLSPSIDPAVADFRLRSGATARNYGAAVDYRAVRDNAGTPRPLTGATDGGAFQTVAGLTFSPRFTPVAGNYAATQSVTLASDTAGAPIVYTTDGTTPSVNPATGAPNGGTSTAYAGAFPVAGPAAKTVKAVAWSAGSTSPVATAVYTFQDLSAVPVTLALETPTGTYPGTVIAQPLTHTPGARMRYTTNGTDPTPTTGTNQSYPGYPVLDFATLRYVAFKTGRANSPVLSATYTVRAQMGNTADGTAVTTIGANKVRFVRFQAANGFSAANVYARLAGGTGGYRAAIYSDNGAAPNKLLASSTLVSNPAAGWTVFPLSSRAALAKSSYYWLAIWSDNASAGIYSTSTGGTVREASGTFSTATWPAPPTPTEETPNANVAATTAVAGTANYAIYAMNQPPNAAPVVSAGADQTIASGASASLAGTVSDDGVPLAPGTVTQAWSKVTGPGAVSFGNAASAATTATFTANGTYVLRLTARDALLTASDDVTVTVSTGSGGPLDPPAPAGTVRDRFSDGSGTTYPQQYPGVAGDGWAGAWSLTGSPAPTATVAGTAPLNGGGNSLSVARTGGSGSTPLHGIYRQWSNATRPYDQFARLTFDVRLDSPASVFNTTTDTLNFTARPTTGATSAADSTFFIRAFGGTTTGAREWKVYNGDGVTGTNAGAYNAARFVGTGMSCDPGETYSFTVDLFGGAAAGSTGGKANGTYDVTITRASDGAAVTVFGARYRSAAYASGGYLSFSTSQDVATDNLAFSVDNVELTALATTTTALASSASRVGYGELVTFTATVAAGGVVPTGPVTFYDNGNVIGTGSLNESGVATLSTSALDTGTHYVSAFYPATPGYTASTSAYLEQAVGSATTATLFSNANPANLGAPVTLNASVVSDNDVPTGTVTFYDNGVVLSTGTLDGSGVATLTTSALSVGLHSIYAFYGGDLAHSGSYPPEFIQTIQRPDGTTRLLAINAAGDAVAGTGFDADYGYDSGNTSTTGNAINLGAVTYPAPMAVYQSERYGQNLTYALGGLNPAGAYLVRLHFSENYWGLNGRTGPGQRLMNVAVNGSTRLANFEIYAAAGGASNKAVIREFAAAADSSGQLVVNLTTVAGSPDTNALVDGLEVYTLTPFDAWRVSRFTPAQLDNVGVSGPNADPDGDGVSNFLERALGTGPLNFSPAGLPTVGSNGSGSLTLTFFRAAADLTYVVEGSSDLLTWTTILPVNPGAVGQSVTVTDDAPPNAAPRFLRLRVTR